MRSKTYSGFNSTVGDVCHLLASCSGVTVSYAGGNALRINGMFPTTITSTIISDTIDSGDEFTLQYTIYGITNPSTITMDQFKILLVHGSTLIVGGAANLSPAI